MVLLTHLPDATYKCTKLQGSQLSNSGDQDFLRFLPYLGMAATLVMLLRPFKQTFVPPLSGGCIQNQIENSPAVSEKKLLEIVGWTDR